MDKLSERLGQEWERASSFAHWAERDPTRGPDEVASWRELAKTLREAAVLAKRYEEAPMVTAWPRVSGGPLVISLDGIVAIQGQRVRLVVEGGEG